MAQLEDSHVVIRTTGTPEQVISTFLRVYLANERLADKQLEVATALVTKYTEYTSNGVIEPYASTLLFSTKTRKELVKALDISSAHLNNTFNALTKKNILAIDEDTYIMNPHLVPKKSITFNFEITDGQPKQNPEGSSQSAEPTN